MSGPDAHALDESKLLDLIRDLDTGHIQDIDRTATSDAISSLWGMVEALRAQRDEAYSRGKNAGLEEAVRAIDTAGDGAVTEALSTQLCCNGQHCGCQGADVGSYLQHIIRALIAQAKGEQT